MSPNKGDKAALCWVPTILEGRLSVGLSYFLTDFGHVEAASPYDDSLYSVSYRGSTAIPLSEASSCLITMKRATI